MTALKWITNEAKRLRRKYPRRFVHWKEYVAEASAIYARKHKGRSPVGKKKRVANVVTKSKSHVDKNRLTTNIQIGGVNKVHAANEVLRLTKEIQNTERQIEVLRQAVRDTKRLQPGQPTGHYKKQMEYLKRLKRSQQRSLSEFKRLL